RTARRVWRRGGRRQEALKEGELLDRVQSGRCGRDLGVGDVIRDSGELAVRVLLTLLLKQLVRDAHLDVVCLAREQQQGLVLRLPPEPGDRSVVAVVVHPPRDRSPGYEEAGMAADPELLLAGAVGGPLGHAGGVRDVLDEARAEARCRK